MIIAHIADVHIRNAQRHTEYEEVFNRLYEKLKELKPDRIVLAGDIFHSKTVTSPESTELAYNLYVNLANIAPLDSIDGNHDLNLNNKKRVSCNSMICGLIKDGETKHPITLYRKSGIYKIADNVNYGIFSISDKENWPIKITDKKEDEVYIALFHGPLNTSKLSDKYHLTTNFSVELFDSYDFAILGDIHKRQGFRAVNHKAANSSSKKFDTVIEYCGSLIQQDFSEDQDKGFVLWDIKTRDIFDKEFYKVENDFGYYTAKLKDFSEFNATEFTNVPLKCLFRVLFDEKLTDFERQTVEQKIISAFAPTNVFVLDGRKQTKNEAAIKDIELISNINSIEAQRELIRTYISKKYPEVQKDNVASIVSMHEQYYEQFKIENNTSKQSAKKWKINHIQFSNLFRFGENNEINFDNMPGIIGLFAPNATGKTSIIEIILWTIFNKTSKKHVKNEDILNVHSSKGHSKITLSHGTDQFVITREITKKVNNKTNKAYYNNSIDIQRIDSNGVSHNENDETKTATDVSIIRPKFGDITDALLSSFASQFGHRQMIEMDHSTRKTVIGKFLGIDIIQNIYDIANRDFVKIKNKFEASSVNNIIDEIQKTKGLYGDTKRDIISLNSTKKAKIKKIDDYKQIEKQLDDTINEFYSKYDESQISTKKGRKTIVKSDISKINAELEKLNLQLQEKVESYEQLETALSPFDDIRNILAKGEKDVKQTEILNSLYGDIKQLEEQKSSSNFNVEYFVQNKEDIFEDNLCNKCGFFNACLGIDGDEFFEKEKLDTETFDDILQTVSKQTHDVIANITDKKKTADEIKQSITVKPEDYYRVKELVEAKNFIEREIEYLNNSLIDKQKLLTSLNDELVTIVQYLDENSSLVHEVEAIEEAVKQKSAVLDNLKSLQKEEKKINDDILVKNNNMHKYEGALEVLIAKQSELKAIADEISLFEYYLSTIHRDGIQSEIIKIVLPYINNEMKDILSNFSCNFVSEMEFDEESQNIIFYIYHLADGSDKQKIEMASGAEQIITSVVLRIAFCNVSSVPSPDFFVIDEGLAALDANNLGSVSKLFDILKNYYKHVLIISHLDSIQDIVEYQIPIKDIVIEKENGVEVHFSNVKQ